MTKVVGVRFKTGGKVYFLTHRNLISKKATMLL